MGCVLPKKEYLEAIRETTADLGIPLIFDEIITGFRLSPGGAQQYYGVTPDLTTLGKAIANGFPLSAVAGKKEIMQITDPGRRGVDEPYVSFSGTYNANQIGIAAATATLAKLEDGKVQQYLNENTSKLTSSFKDIAEELEMQAHIQHIAGKFQLYFTDQEITDYRTALKYAASKESIKRYEVLAQSLLNRGLYWPATGGWHSHHGITAAHSEKDMTMILRNIAEALEGLQEGIGG
jgi:glutamate-1-semialdehyde 2,1-aminomutase